MTLLNLWRKVTKYRRPLALSRNLVRFSSTLQPDRQPQYLNFYPVNMKRVNHQGSRFYEVEGYRGMFPSVTSIFKVLDKGGLQNWSNNLIMGSIRSDLTDKLVKCPIECDFL